MNSDNPILNSPYDEPKLHYATDTSAELSGYLISLSSKEFKKWRTINYPSSTSITYYNEKTIKTNARFWEEESTKIITV